MLETVDKFIIVVTESKDVFQWNSETECALWVWLLNNATLPDCKTCVVITCTCT